jgi:HEAT repeat protein
MTILRLCIILAFVACQRNGVPRHEEPMSSNSPPDAGAPSTVSGPSADEIRTHIRFAQPRHGDRPDLAQRDTSIAWLLAHADDAYPIVLDEVRASPGAAGITLLGRFDRKESTPVLSAIMEDGEGDAGAAAFQLALASDPAALAAAIAATRHDNPDIASAAVDGLGKRGDRGQCAAIVAATTHDSAEVRYMAVEAGAALGCLDNAALARLAKSDPDAEVRARAQALVTTKP